MKSFKSLLTVAVVALTGFTVKAQTADEIINKHLDAIGGKDKLAQITSEVIDASINAMGNDNPAKVYLLVGKGYKNEMEFNGQKIIQAVNPDGGWMINPMQGSSDAQAMPDDQFKSAKGQMYPDPFLDYAAHGSKVELKGTDGDDYKIVLTTSDNAVTTYFINKNTYLVSKLVRTMNMMGNDVDLTMTFSDYKKTDFGNTAAYTTEMAYGSMFSMTLTIKTITINSQLDPAIFQMPK